jgi:hypothetical protein
VKKVLLLLVFICSVRAASAQTTQFAGVIEDLSQNAVQAGNVAFTLRPGIDTTISGNARFTPTTINCPILNPSVTSTTSTGTTVTVNVTPAQVWQAGDILIFRGTADSVLNSSTVAFPYTITIVNSTTSFTFAEAGSHNNGAGGTVGGIYASAGTGACIVTQNSAINPAYTSYSVAIQPANTTTSSFNTYAIGSGPIDISTIVPTPSQQPSYSFVDLFSNGQVISGQKSFTNVNNTYAGGTFNNPIINNPTITGASFATPIFNSATLNTPFFGTQPITLISAFNYSLTWSTPGAARIINIPDPGANDTFAFLGATQTLQGKTIGLGNILQVGAFNGGTGANGTTFWRGDGVWASPASTTFPQVVYNTISATSTGNLGPIAMATPAANSDYRVTFYVEVTAPGIGCNTISQVAITMTWTDPLAGGNSTFGNGTTQGIFANLSTGLGVAGPATSYTTGLGTSAGNATMLAPTLTIRAKSGQVISYSTVAIPSGGCSTNITYQVVPILEQLTAN